MIRRREQTSRQQSDKLEARDGFELHHFEDRSSEEKPDFGSPARKSPLSIPEHKNRSDTYDYFGSISGVFGKTDSRAKVRFEEFFKSPTSTPMKDRQISSFTKGGLLSHSSDKKRSAEKPFQLQLDSIRIELDFPVPGRIPHCSKRVGEGQAEQSSSGSVCAVCRLGVASTGWSAGCCGARVCCRCEQRFVQPRLVRGAACPFCVGGQLRAAEEDWSSL